VTPVWRASDEDDSDFQSLARNSAFRSFSHFENCSALRSLFASQCVLWPDFITRRNMADD
jgi:hypothetical protein